MSLRSAMEEALQRGEKIKDQVLSEVLSSEALNQLMQNELFLKSLTKILTTKHEIQQAMKKNMKVIFQALKVPTRDEINSLERKFNRLENEVGSLQRKTVSASLAKKKKATRKAPKKKVAKKKAKRTRARR